MKSNTLQQRPLIHFTPPENWMNDPNGLVFYDGRYHLFYQHNPFGRDHANMSWGHASSVDLVDWKHHDVAISPDKSGTIFSGSIVVDQTNTSGLGTSDRPPLVAIYTLAAPGNQSQALAYSIDGGDTWRKYAANPVLDRNSPDFRDPKVFWYEDETASYWVLVAVEALEREVVFYRSDNLIDWDFLSSYGPAGAVGGIWECPDLFRLPVDGDVNNQRWVLLISLNPGSIAGGSGTQYVVGNFDGVTFAPDIPIPLAHRGLDGEFVPQGREDLESFMWLDYGSDCYAGVTFFGLPEGDRILIAWMSNWDYAHTYPTLSWRGSMTLPRRLDLVSAAGELRIRQTPVTGRVRSWSVDDVSSSVDLSRTLPRAGMIDLKMRVEPDSIALIRLKHDNAGDGGITITFNRSTGILASDRSISFVEGMPAEFQGQHAMPVATVDGSIELRIVFDVSSFEIFAADGTRALSCLAVYGGDADLLSIGSVEGAVTVDHLRIDELHT